MSIEGRATRRALNRDTDYYSLEAAEALGLAGVSRLPFSLKVVLENVLRQQAEGRSDGGDIAAVAGWLATRRAEREIAFRFTRVLMPDSSGVPLLGDLAAMRDAMIRLGGDPGRLNPAVPVDLVVDHSVMVDAYGTADAAARNQVLELQRNAERYAFLRWGGQAFSNLRIVPPGNGICHQVNLEYLARVVWTSGGVSGFRARHGQPHRHDQRPRHLRLGCRRAGGRRGRAGRIGRDAGPRSDRLPPGRQARPRRHVHRPRPHRDADVAPPQGGGQVR
jgi:aconitate hydratase